MSQGGWCRLIAFIVKHVNTYTAVYATGFNNICSHFYRVIKDTFSQHEFAVGIALIRS